MTRASMLCSVVLLAMACNSDDDTGETGDPMTTGTIEANDFDRSAIAESFTAIGFATNGVGVVVLSANPAATCDNITAYFKEGGSYDPSDVLKSGGCNTTFRFNYDSDAGFDGVVHTQDDVGTLVNVNCAMGEGTWEITGTGNDRGFQFVGEEAYWWQGNAKTFSITTAVGASDNTPDLELSMGPDFGGQFIYEDLEPDPATGSVTGSVVVESCQGLTQTPPWN